MSDTNTPKVPDSKRLFEQRRSQLITAIYSTNSPYNGDLIYALLEELRQLQDESLASEFVRCEELVQRWKETWYPDLW